MQPHGTCPDRIADERLEQGSARRDELTAELPQEFTTPRIAAVVIGGCKSLLGGREHALKVDEEPVFNQVGVDATGSPAEELDLEPGHRMTGRRFEFTLRFERHPALSRRDHSGTPPRGGVSSVGVGVFRRPA